MSCSTWLAGLAEASLSPILVVQPRVFVSLHWNELGKTETVFVYLYNGFGYPCTNNLVN